MQSPVQVSWLFALGLIAGAVAAGCAGDPSTLTGTKDAGGLGQAPSGGPGYTVTSPDRNLGGVNNPVAQGHRISIRLTIEYTPDHDASQPVLLWVVENDGEPHDPELTFAVSPPQVTTEHTVTIEIAAGAAARLGPHSLSLHYTHPEFASYEQLTVKVTPPCVADTDCPDEQRCRTGACITPGRCSADSDCDEGQACRFAECVARCLRDDQCPATLRCLDNLCVAPAPDQGLPPDAVSADGSSHADAGAPADAGSVAPCGAMAAGCPPGTHCADELCIDDAVECHPACPAGELCFEGTCLPGRPCPNGDVDCAANEHCNHQQFGNPPVDMTYCDPYPPPYCRVDEGCPPEQFCNTAFGQCQVGPRGVCVADGDCASEAALCLPNPAGGSHCVAQDLDCALMTEIAGTPPIAEPGGVRLHWEGVSRSEGSCGPAPGPELAVFFDPAALGSRVLCVEVIGASESVVYARSAKCDVPDVACAVSVGRHARVDVDLTGGPLYVIVDAAIPRFVDDFTLVATDGPCP